MKAGANPRDVTRINRMYKDGKSAKQISEAVGVDIDCVKSFKPKAEDKK